MLLVPMIATSSSMLIDLVCRMNGFRYHQISTPARSRAS
jgi:hypothetical protein